MALERCLGYADLAALRLVNKQALAFADEHAGGIYVSMSTLKEVLGWVLIRPPKAGEQAGAGGIYVSLCRFVVMCKGLLSWPRCHGSRKSLVSRAGQ